MKQKAILYLIIVVYLVNGIFSINRASITFDEPSHISFGQRILKGNPDRSNPELDNSKMPISALNSLPRVAEQILNPGMHKSDGGFSDIMHGRYITLVFSVFILLLVYKWSSSLYGINAGLFSAFLFSVCPNNLANATLVTTDSYAAFFLPAVMYCLWKYCNNKSLFNFILFAILLALSQLAKQSLFHLYVATPLCLLFYSLFQKDKINIKAIAGKLLLAVSISWLLINAGFAFYKMNNTIGDFHFMSSFFHSLQQLLPSWFPIPVSRSFVEGLDQAKYYDQLGGGFFTSSFGTVNVMGHSAIGGRFWYYYIVTIIFKTPVIYLIYFGWGFYYLVKKETFRSFVKNEFFLLAPIVYYLLYMSFIYRTQCGIRHIIFIYPFLFIFCGILLKYIQNRLQLYCVTFLCLWLVLNIGVYFNNYYTYTNEFIWDKKNAYKIVGTGNLNFSQAHYILEDYLKDHPDVMLAPEKPQPGKYVIIVDELVDVWNTGKYKWMRDLQPVGHVAFCYLLFDVRQSDLR